MLWIEPSTVVYASIFGAFVGAAVMAWTQRKCQREQIKILESYWNNDYKRVMYRIERLEQQKSIQAKLSPDSVNKPVHKQWYGKNKGRV